MNTIGCTMAPTAHPRTVCAECKHHQHCPTANFDSWYCRHPTVYGPLITHVSGETYHVQRECRTVNTDGECKLYQPAEVQP
jgi:hypothetical protein